MEAQQQTETVSKGGGCLRFALYGLIALAVGAIILAGVLEARDQGPASTAQGNEAPGFTIEKYGGGTVSLAQLHGKVVMLDFWATWCPPCVAEIPHLVKLADEYQDKGVVFVAASRDDPDTAKADVGIFIARRVPRLAKYAAFASDDMATRYGIEALPTLYFIGPDGKILDRARGGMSEERLRSMIDRALSHAGK